MRVLVIEDETRLASNIAAAMHEGPGWAVDVAENGIVGRESLLQTDYDLIVLDLMLPGLDGLIVLKSLRDAGKGTPVLILTAVVEKTSVVELLNAGADDYLAKPFDLGELLARCKALIRRGKGLSHPVIRIGDLVVDTTERSVNYQGIVVDLSPTEYRVLEFLAHRPRSVISKQTLLEHLYDYNWERHSNVIEVHISNLRRKLTQAGSDVWVETLRGRGYRLMAPYAPATR
jgi:two-component system response regulator PhoP